MAIGLGFALLLAAAAARGAELVPFEPAEPHPTFSLRDLAGNVRAMEDYRGKVVLVNFWASWCPPCIHEMPKLKALKAKLAERPFEILAINVDEPKYKVWKFVKLTDFNLPVLLDPLQKTYTAWDAITLPTSFLLDRRGRIRYRVQGVPPEWDSDAVTDIIETLITDEEKE